MSRIAIVAAKRNPFGKFLGTLAGLSATDLAVESSRAALQQSGLSAQDIEATVFGNVLQSSVDAIYLPRHVGLKLGVPMDRPALGVNRLCGSGFEAIAQGAYLLMNEGMNCVLVGGSESMSQVPYVLRGARTGYRMGPGEVEDYLTGALTDSHVKLPMALTAENLAEKYGISREMVDAYSLKSQQRAAKAWDRGFFKDEVAPVVLESKKGKTEFLRDEHMRAETTLESLAKLPALFKKGGTVHAGSASGIVDGASSLILCNENFAKSKNLKILAFVESWAFVGCDPSIMGIGPVPAAKKALEKLSAKRGKKIAVSDMKRVEINEAFAAQYLAVERELELDPEKTNVNGGAIAIGHPLAASGARLTSTLIYELKALGGGFGLAAACIGGGQGMAVIIEVV
jgi:acetyl-CoA acyltransferase 2